MGRRQRRLRKQKGGLKDLHQWLKKVGRPLHVPGYHYLGPGTPLSKNLQQRRVPINRLDAAAMRHDIAYSRSKTLQDKLKADRRMVNEIRQFPGRLSKLEKATAGLLFLKQKLKI